MYDPWRKVSNLLAKILHKVFKCDFKRLIGLKCSHLSFAFPGLGRKIMNAPLNEGSKIPFWKDSLNISKRGVSNLHSDFL